MKVVLVHPEIPQNTGNIVRTCAVTGTGLVLVRPLGFSITNRFLKRAGLDYWEGVEVEVVDDLFHYLETSGSPCTFFSSKGSTLLTEVHFEKDHLLVFGSESSGLPDNVWERYPGSFCRIPMIEGSRCLNLATSCGVAVYEALRGRSFF